MFFLDKALDILFPKTCGICEKITKNNICEECYENIKKYFVNNSEKEQFYLLKYEEIVRNKILEYKFKDKSYLYKMFCEIIFKSENACDFLQSYDIIIPVPIHSKRMKERGYNQSELIAREISKKLKIAMYTDVLEKKVYTPMQSSLGKNSRLKNVHDVYYVNNKTKILGKKTLILDDIYTTGATTLECKRILKLEGIENVGIFTIAKD